MLPSAPTAGAPRVRPEAVGCMGLGPEMGDSRGLMVIDLALELHRRAKAQLFNGSKGSFA